MVRSKTERRGKWLYRLLVFCTALVFLLVATEAALVIRERTAWAFDPDINVFNETCGHCHSTATPRSFAKGPHQWRDTVDRMIRKNEGGWATPISEATRETLVGVLVRHRSASGAELVRHRCGACHGRDSVDAYLDLAPAVLAEMVDQHTSRLNFAIQAWEADLIREELLARQRLNPSTSGRTEPGAQLRYQRVCGTCHTPRFLYRTACRPPRSDAEWERVVDRMRRKEPGNFAEGDVKALVAHVAQICRTGRIAP